MKQKEFDPQKEHARTVTMSMLVRAIFREEEEREREKPLRNRQERRSNKSKGGGTNG